MVESWSLGSGGKPGKHKVQWVNMLLGLHGNTQVTLLGWSFTLYVATLWIMHSPSVEEPKSQCGDSRDLWWFVTQFNHMTAASHISIVAPVMPPQKGASPSGLCVDVSVSAQSGVLELSHLCKEELSWLKSLSFQDQPTWFKIQFVSLVAGVHSLCLMQITDYAVTYPKSLLPFGQEVQACPQPRLLLSLQTVNCFVSFTINMSGPHGVLKKLPPHPRPSRAVTSTPPKLGNSVNCINQS